MIQRLANISGFHITEPIVQAIRYLSNYNYGEDFATIFQNIKSIMSHNEFTSVCNYFEDIFILQNLCIKPWNSDQLSSIFDILQHIVPTKSRFNLDGKEELFNFISCSEDIQLFWSKCNPKAIQYFSNNSEVFAVVFQKLKSVLNQHDFVKLCEQILREGIRFENCQKNDLTEYEPEMQAYFPEKLN